MHGPDNAFEEVKIEIPFRRSVKFDISGNSVPTLLLIRTANDDPERVICEVNTEHGTHLNENCAGWCRALDNDRIVSWSQVAPHWRNVEDFCLPEGCFLTIV